MGKTLETTIFPYFFKDFFLVIHRVFHRKANYVKNPAILVIILLRH